MYIRDILSAMHGVLVKAISLRSFAVTRHFMATHHLTLSTSIHMLVVLIKAVLMAGKSASCAL